MRIYITGHKGRLGSELVRQGCLPLCDDNWEETDITDLGALRTEVNMVAPDAIINCAAFTKVDACEDEATYLKVLKFNIDGIKNLFHVFSGPIIHISSDYVFDGVTGPYKETRSTGKNGPVNKYGWTKLGSEITFLLYARSHDMMIRTTGLYGRSAHHDFVKLVRNTLQAGKELLVSQTLHGNHTYTPHLAEALIHIAHRPDDFRNTSILHVASKEVISRYEFAQRVARTYGLDERLLTPVDNNQIEGWVAKRPVMGGLRVGLAEKMGVPIYSIDQGLEALHGEDHPA